MTTLGSTEESPLWHQEDDATVESQLATIPLCHGTLSKTTPIPKVQLTILCLLRPLDPMSFTQIFPYINEFMSDLKVTNDPSRVGFYSGLVESSFAFSQLLAVYPWGFLSDRFGRRPVVLIGTLGLSITTLLFGFSTSFIGTILTRALAGLFSGNVPVIPTILIELTDQTNQAFAFSFFGFWWPIGAIIGPLVGGLLSNPARHYPRYFDYEFFKQYPYFLPCLIVSSFGLISFIIAALLLEETYQKGSNDAHKPPSYRTIVDHTALEVSKKFTIKELLEIRIIRALCASGCSLSFISTAFDVLFVLFCYSPISGGGLGFPTDKIGFALSVSGFFAAILQVVFMPTILRRVNHAVMYHFCMKIWPFTFLFLPLLNVVARQGILSETGKLDSFTISLLWCGIAFILCMTRVAFLAYSVNMLLIKRFAPNSSSLGSTTGLVQFSICFSRAFSPAFASSIFAFSANGHLLGGYLWVVIMVSLGFASSLFSRNIVQESVAL